MVKSLLSPAGGLLLAVIASRARGLALEDLAAPGINQQKTRIRRTGLGLHRSGFGFASCSMAGPLSSAAYPACCLAEGTATTYTMSGHPQRHAACCHSFAENQHSSLADLSHISCSPPFPEGVRMMISLSSLHRSFRMSKCTVHIRRLFTLPGLLKVLTVASATFPPRHWEPVLLISIRTQHRAPELVCAGSSTTVWTSKPTRSTA